jgi:hypothetical protein
MANAKASLGAPTYDRLGIDRETAQPTNPEHQARVIAALRLGWELEELVARSYLLGDPWLPAPNREIPGSPEMTGSEREPANSAGDVSLFVPDLFHSQSAQARLESVMTIVRAQPALMFPGAFPPDRGSAAAGSVQTSAARQLAALASAVDSLPHIALEPEGADVMGDDVKRQLRAQIAESARRIDDAVVNILLDPTYTGETGAKLDPVASLLLSGYELGKALSGTRWLLWAAHMLNEQYDPDPPPKAASVRPAWRRVFDSSRLGTIQRQLGNLTPVFGGRVIMAVTKSLDYWRAALLDASILSLEPAASKSRVARAARSEWAHGVWTRSEAEVNLPLDDRNLNQEIILFAALCQQVDAWYDLLTLRRKPEDFPITGLVSNLLRQVAAQQVKSATAFIAPYLRGAAVVAFLLVIAVVVAMILATRLLPNDTGQTITAGGVLALGSGILGSFGALLTRRATPAAQSLTASADLEQRIAQLERQLQQTAVSVRSQAQEAGGAMRVGAEAAQQQLQASFGPTVPPEFSWQNVVHAAATDVVNQLRLEEIYLGVSEPLVRYVLAPEAGNGAAIRDPQAAAARFLDLIYESTPNIERLGGVLIDLYRASATPDTQSRPRVPAA